MPRILLTQIALSYPIDGVDRHEEGAVLVVDDDTPADLVAVLASRIAAGTAEVVDAAGRVSVVFAGAAAAWAQAQSEAARCTLGLVEAVEAGGAPERAAFLGLLEGLQVSMADLTPRFAAIYEARFADLAQTDTGSPPTPFTGSAELEPSAGSVSTPAEGAAGVEGAPAEPTPAIVSPTAALAAELAQDEAGGQESAADSVSTSAEGTAGALDVPADPDPSVMAMVADVAAFVTAASPAEAALAEPSASDDAKPPKTTKSKRPGAAD